jgi:hypothetical protein
MATIWKSPTAWFGRRVRKSRPLPPGSTTGHSAPDSLWAKKLYSSSVGPPVARMRAMPESTSK